MDKQIIPEKTFNYETTFVGFLCAIGIILKLFIGTSTSQDGSYGPASATIWGYGLIALAVLSLMFMTFSLATKQYEKQGTTFGFVKLLLKNSLPPLLLFIILVWIIYLNASYRLQINEGRVATEYNQFSTISTIMIIFQIILLFKYLTEDYQVQSGGPTNKKLLKEALKSQSAHITYVLTILNLIFIGMMNVIVEFFSTDG